MEKASKPRARASHRNDATVVAPCRRWPRRVAIGVATVLGVALAFLLVAATIFAAVFHVHVGNGIGDQTYDVATYGNLRPEYKRGIGDLRVDMRDVRLPVGVTHLHTRVDVGRLVVLEWWRVARAVGRAVPAR